MLQFILPQKSLKSMVPHFSPDELVTFCLLLHNVDLMLRQPFVFKH